MAPFPILSIDGGGIRGIIPALILAELERRAKRPVSKLFRLVAGTSTGGILALGLTCPAGKRGRKKPRYSAADLAEMYAQDGGRIFSRSVWHRIRAVGNLGEEKYPAKGLETVLAERFGDARLADALVPILVTAYDIEVRKPHFFKSDRAAVVPERNFLMADAARATSAAPTYFEPAYIRAREADDPIALVDGGVFANNPAACALVEAIVDHKQSPDSVIMLSLGTGELTRPILYDDAKGWGLAKWAQPILSVVFDGVSDTVSYQVDSILQPIEGRSRYLRIQCPLTEGNDDMDDASATNIRVLKILAREVIDRYDRELDHWVGLLTGGG